MAQQQAAQSEPAADQAPAPAPAPRKSSTVFVGCKLPNGLVIDHEGASATLRGANHSELIGGFGITEVPADLWEVWSKKFRDNPLITTGIVFAQGTFARAKAAAKDAAELVSGFERLNPEKPTPGVEKVDEEG